MLNGGSKVATAKKDTKKYRLMTGTFPTKTDLHAAAEKLKKATGWAVYEKESDGLRLMTGTFTGKAEAEQAAAKVKKLFGWVVYVKEA
ncbi:SPOR domain-containing protein [Bacillus smithii]|nr:SPOR domain-containing protein [Bacillus smithii]MED1456668.1 SPOR domain-containing protein [Bacillus smithii]